MAHIHLAWELGGGLGHAGRLKVFAQELLKRGHKVSMSLRDLGNTRRLLAGTPVPTLQAPVWLHRTLGMPPTQASLAEILIPCGYLEPGALDGLTAGWRSMFAMVGADMVVSDYAPTALLAARSMGLPSAAVGIGFYSPPAGQPLPNLRPWENIGERRLAAAEQHMLNSANTVLARYAAKPYSYAADVLLGDKQLLCTWPELDHYGRAAEAGVWYGPNFLRQTGEMPVWPAGSGHRVFCYLKQEFGQCGAVLQALVEEGCRVLCYMPEVASGMTPPVVSPLIHYAAGPVSMRETLMDADLCVCHAGEATLVQSLLAAVPLLMLPLQLEQFLIALRVETGGAGVNAVRLAQPVDWRDLVRRLLGDQRYRTAAHVFAARYAQLDPDAMTGHVVDQFERVLAEYGAGMR